MNVVYPTPSHNEMCYVGTAMYMYYQRVGILGNLIWKYLLWK